MKLVRLSSGEEIIGNVKENRDNSVTITNGYSLIPAGEGKIGFMPFMAYTEAAKGITISDRFVLFVVEPCLLYTSPSPRDGLLSRMPSSA